MTFLLFFLIYLIMVGATFTLLYAVNVRHYKKEPSDMELVWMIVFGFIWPITLPIILGMFIVGQIFKAIR